MYGFLRWFKEFFGNMLTGIFEIFKGIIFGIAKVFDFPYYFSLWKSEGSTFGAADWILSLLFFLVILFLWALLFWVIFLGIRKIWRFNRRVNNNEDLLEEISDLHREVTRLVSEKDKLLQIKVTEAGLSYEQFKAMYDEQMLESEKGDAKAEKQKEETAVTGRFQRLCAVDEKYAFYEAPEYDKISDLQDLCADIRNYACTSRGLYYEMRTIRLMIAGLASTKLVVLQGISGTGKTSLPYVMGKYFKNDSTIASVQPSWRDRNELFGYFNEFTKKFNETEVLKRIYEANYTNDMNLIILDEMNIARVEYYFAEMLSILEMPNADEWKIELVPSTMENDPARLEGGNLKIPQNVWYIGTINNDDSTFTVSDKVYDRAFVINLDNKGIPFEAPVTEAKRISYSELSELYDRAVADNPVSQEILDCIEKLDNYVIEKFRVAFGNRIMKQLKRFVPVYVACGGTEKEGVDYILATKVFRKFESLNLSLIRDEIRPLISFMDNLFGKGEMKDCTAYLQLLQKMY